MKISACMPHRNYFEHVVNTLESLRNQNLRLHEIVIMDDESDNGDWERLISLWEKWDHQTILTLRRLENNPADCRSKRIPYCRNQAFMALTEVPDYLFFPDADDLWNEGYTRRCVDIMEEDKTIDFVYPDVTQVDNEPGKKRLQGKRVKRHIDVSEFNVDALFRICYIPYCSIMRTSAFLDAGMWPEDHYKKEYVFWNIMARTGHKGKRLPGRWFLYLQHAAQRHREFKDVGGQENPDRHERYNSRLYISNKFNIQQ